MPQRSYAGRTAAERRADRRERLLAAGLELFGTDGYAATPIEKICATAGVSTRNFYEEFGSREALLMALHDRVTKRAIDAVAAALSSGDGGGAAGSANGAAGSRPGGCADHADHKTRVRRRIEVATDAYVSVLTSDPRWTRIASVELVGVSRAVEEHRLRWRALWAKLLEAEAAGIVGRPVAGRTDYHLGAVAIIGAVNELMLNWCATGGDSPPCDITATIVRFIMGMLTSAL
jgi:AcrR family transcriptional regulator